MSETKLQRGLSPRHVLFIGLGSAVGTGLFYGSAGAIQLAGPAIMLTYLISGIAVFMVMRALGEMILHNPMPGAFGAYATKYLGPLAGFITGWTYVFEMALVCLADVTAFGTYLHFWYPEIPIWMSALGVTLVLCGINLCTVKLFGELSFWLSLLKIVAIVAMILVGGYLIFSGMITSTGNETETFSAGVSNLWAHGGFAPNGVMGIIISFSIVIFSFGGVETLGLTALEARNPEKTIPMAINVVPIQILLFYFLAIVVLLCLFPWNQIGLGGSPFVVIFQNIGISSAANILNIVVITAALSAINNDIFGAGRMMYGLAKEGQAPKSFGVLTKNDVPLMPVLVMFGVLMIGVILNYFIHDGLFFIIAAMATFATVWVWLTILVSQVAMRRSLTPEEAKKLKFPIPFWPVGPAIAILFMVFVIAVIGLYNWAALATGAIWVALLIISYYIWVKDKKAQVDNI